MSAHPPSSSSFSEAERKRRVAILTEMHRPLQDHWDGRHLFLDANESEFNYKHHLAKLKDIYTTYQSEFLSSSNTDVTANYKGGKRISAQLYGKHGLKSTASFVPKWEKNREKDWDDDVKTESIRQQHKISLKKKSNNERSPPKGVRDRPQEHNGTKQMDSIIHNERRNNHNNNMNNNHSFNATNSSYNNGNNNSESDNNSSMYNNSDNYSTTTNNNNNTPVDTPLKWLRYRCSDEISTEDATMLGLYRLNEQQSDAYLQFVHTLSEFDPFEMKKILQDAYSDARALSSLESYKGTLPTQNMSGNNRK